MLILYSFFLNDSIGIFMRYPCLKIMSVFHITLTPTISLHNKIESQFVKNSPTEIDIPIHRLFSELYTRKLKPKPTETTSIVFTGARQCVNIHAVSESKRPPGDSPPVSSSDENLSLFVRSPRLKGVCSLRTARGNVCMRVSEQVCVMS